MAQNWKNNELNSPKENWEVFVFLVKFNLFWLNKILLTANFPKISKATSSNKNIVKNKLVLLNKKKPDKPTSNTNIKYSVENDIFWLNKYVLEIKIINSTHTTI